MAATKVPSRFLTVLDSDLSTSDITTNNFTTAKHGFVPKGTNAGNFLKDDGTWATPSGGGSSTVTINTQTASYTLVSGDGTNTDVRMNVATANNLTVPLNSSVGFSVGAQIIVTSIGIGQTTIVATGGVTINIPLGCTLKLRTQFSKAVLEKTATDTWDLSGDLESASYIVKHLTTSASANSTTTLASITDLELTLGVGSYNITAWIRYQAGATTTGVKFAFDHTGTITSFLSWMRFAGTGSTASTGAATMVGAGATGNVYEAYGQRTKGTAMAPTVSVDAANSDMLMIIECLITVSVSGTLKLMHASEVAASSQVMSGTNLIIIKTN